MGLGTLELVLLAVVIAGTLAAVAVTKNRYLLGVIGFFVIAAVCTPADPLSMLLIAIPSAGIYGFALWKQRRTVAQ